MLTRSALRASALVAALAAVVAGCGIKGPLVAPAPAAAKPAEAAAPAQDTPAKRTEPRL